MRKPNLGANQSAGQRRRDQQGMARTRVVRYQQPVVRRGNPRRGAR
jgi:hypothetical protein